MYFPRALYIHNACDNYTNSMYEVSICILVLYILDTEIRDGKGEKENFICLPAFYLTTLFVAQIGIMNDDLERI
jgi:hypothetical protein